MTRKHLARPFYGLATLLAGAIAGCNSPTLPLPPPDSPQVADVSADGLTVHLVGSGASPGGLVIFFNDDLGKGVIVTTASNGVYDATVPVDLRNFDANEMEMWQRVGTQDSSVVVFLVPLHGTFTPTDDAGRSDSSSADGGVTDDASSAPSDGGMSAGDP
jgi:hypothetical protein